MCSSPSSVSAVSVCPWDKRKARRRDNERQQSRAHRRTESVTQTAAARGGGREGGRSLNHVIPYLMFPLKVITFRGRTIRMCVALAPSLHPVPTPSSFVSGLGLQVCHGQGRLEGEGRFEGEERLPEGRSTAYTTPSEARVKTFSSLSPFSLLSSILATMACNKLISKVIERDRTALHSENSYCFTQGCMSLSHPGPVMTRARTGFTQLAPSSIKPPYFVYR